MSADTSEGGSPFGRPQRKRVRPTYSPATTAVVSGRPHAGPDAPLNEAVVFASAYHAGGPVAYARDGNPTWSAFEEALGALEGGSAVAFASGMAATAAVFEEVPIGAAVVVPHNGYYGTRSFLHAAVKGRWEIRAVDVADTQATIAACEGAALLWLESPTNPMLDVVDLPALSAAVRPHGTLVVMDNTLMTPLGQRALDLGADVVVHSATKLLSGHSDVILGAAVAPRDGDTCATLRQRRSLAGAIPGPMETYLALRGLRTLPLRYERSNANAAELANRLAAHECVTTVRYPGLTSDPSHQRACSQFHGFGSLVSFEVDGGADAAEAVARSVRLIVHATSLGGIETTIERRSKWPGELAPESLLRLSVGCEDIDDLWEDLDHALGIAAAVRRLNASHVAISPTRERRD